jgi:hypothetical protein
LVLLQRNECISLYFSSSKFAGIIIIIIIIVVVVVAGAAAAAVRFCTTYFVLCSCAVFLI